MSLLGIVGAPGPRAQGAVVPWSRAQGPKGLWSPGLVPQGYNSGLGPGIRISKHANLSRRVPPPHLNFSITKNDTNSKKRLTFGGGSPENSALAARGRPAGLPAGAPWAPHGAPWAPQGSILIFV